MGLKDDIIETARKMYNAKGLRKVTARAICTELNISPGSFSYHYPMKNQLIVDIFERYLAEMAHIIKEVDFEEISILYFLRSKVATFKLQNKYKFFYLNLFEILANYPEIKTRYSENLIFEQAISKELFEVYALNDVFESHTMVDEIDKLAALTQLLHTSWMLDSEIMGIQKFEDKLKHYLKLCVWPLEKFLTLDAREEYESFMESI